MTENKMSDEMKPATSPVEEIVAAMSSMWETEDDRVKEVVRVVKEGGEWRATPWAKYV